MQKIASSFYRLQYANLFSGVSNSLMMIAVPWLVLEQTGSPFYAGLSGALAGIPGIIVSPFIGVLIDKIGARIVSVLSDLLSALSVLLFPVFYYTGLLNIWVILALTVIGAIFDPAGYTARKSMIPKTAKKSNIGIDHANGIHEGIFAVGWVIGPAIGAILISKIGVMSVMWFAMTAFVIAAFCIFSIKYTKAVSNSPTSVIEKQFIVSLKEGLHALKKDKLLLSLTIIVSIIALIYMPTEGVILPTHFESVQNPTGLGLTISALALGGVATSFGFGLIRKRFKARTIIYSSIFLAWISIFIMSFLPSTPIMITAAFLLGLGWGPMEPLLNEVVQKRSLPELHGRIYGLQMTLYYAAPAIGLFISGIAVSQFGIDIVYKMIALLMFVMLTVTLFNPYIRKYT
ncbi:MFS transporter [Candidatus Saccharibacteria bacterium]|nr:MFS transporter [Candidatus Saccharibacteria bacterium]